MKEVIVFARAGQGAITTAQVLGISLIKAGRYAYAFPHFGAARMGAPMNAFLRFDDKPIRLRNQIKLADVAVVVDDTLFTQRSPADTLKQGGIAVVNSTHTFPAVDGKKVVSVPAADISVRIAGRPLANTVLLGALCALSPEFSLEKLNEAMKERFPGKLLDINVKLAAAGNEFIKQGN